MKPIQSILILLSLFLTFSCDDDTQTNEDTDDMMSLDWILLMKGGDYYGSSQYFYVESCDGYVECSYYESYNENNDTYYTQCDNDEYEGYNCKCDEYDDECGECRLTIPYGYRVNSCDGYELCVSNNSKYDCCYEYEYNDYDSLGNIIDTEKSYYYYEYLFNEYILYWNNDLLVCNGSYCDEEDLGWYDYDIVIPSHIPKIETNDCEGEYNYCEREEYFHPNCDTPLDTTITIDSKNISFEKMGWLDRENSNNKFGYIHYYPLDKYLIFEGDDDLDISSYKVVDYQRKE